MPSGGSTPHVAIIGAGFCGLAAGYELSKRGIRVTLFEKDQDTGGLAGSFQVGGIPGVRLEKFYHHWFNHDRYIMSLAEELGVQDEVVFRPTLTGMYYRGEFYRLSSPTDVLRYKPLPLSDRIRLGLLTLQARWVKDWRCLEKLTAAQWLRQMGGERVYQVVWEPLLRGKFGEYCTLVCGSDAVTSCPCETCRCEPEGRSNPLTHPEYPFGEHAPLERGLPRAGGRCPRNDT